MSRDESMEERIARFTPEQRAVYEQQVADRRTAMTDGQPWVKHYLMTPPFAWTDEARQWVRTRPRSVQELLVRFPPSCLVRARPDKHLMVPAPGTFGIVVSWTENELVSVVQSPTSGVRCQCEAGWLEVAAYRDGQSPEDIKTVLGWT